MSGGGDPLWSDIEPGEWAIYRLDDNGNTYMIRGGLSETFARRAAQTLQHRGHKQTYWADIPAKDTPQVQPSFNG